MSFWDRFRGRRDRLDGYSPPDPPQGDPWRDPALKRQMVEHARQDGRMDEKINLDGFVNQLTGIGDWNQDKTFGGQMGGPDFFVDLLSGIACENRWRGSDLGGRIVESLPDEMTREGWKLQVQPSDEDESNEKKSDAFPPSAGGDEPPPPRMQLKEIDDEGAEISQAVMDACEELQLDDRITEALQYERAYGGAAILIGADDGQELTQPLDEERIKSIDYVNAFRGGWDGEVVAWSYNRNPSDKDYGMPEMYMLRNIGVPVARVPAPGEKLRASEVMPALGSTGYGSLITWVHASRFIVFPGLAVSRRARVQMRGWGDSVFTRVDRVLRNYDQTWDGIANLMTDFSQGVLKMEGLAQILAANNKAGTQVLSTKARSMQMSRSIARILLIDGKEEFKRDSASLAGVPEMMQQFSLRLAAAADMPVTLLMGQAPAGLNATGDSDIRFFYDRVKSRQRRRLTPRLKRFIHLLFSAERGPTAGDEPARYSIMHNPLYQMTALEQADLRLKTNQADDLEIKNQVLTPEEVAASEWAGSEWSPNRTIDFEGRAEMAAQDEKDRQERAKAMLEASKAPALPVNGQPPATSNEEAAKSKPPFDRGDEFNEEDHPRDKDGKFASGGGGGGTVKEGTGRGRALSGGELLKHAEATGGFTFNPATQAFPKEGFAVSVHPGHERVVKGKITGKDIKDYLRAKASFVKSNPGAHVGLWHDVEAGKWYLDVSHVEENRATAVKLAREHGQEGIYSLHEGKTIIVKKKSERRLL